MIREFFLENFASFHQGQNISFVTPSPIPFVSSRSQFGDGIVNFMVAVGPNASGKTNILKALIFLQNFISTVSDRTESKGIYFPAFAFQERKNPSSLHIELEEMTIGRRYRYEVTFNSKKVISEYLYRLDIGKRWKRLLAREWNDTMPKCYDFYIHKDLKMNKTIFFETLREDTSFFIAFKILKNDVLNDFFKLVNYSINMDVSFDHSMIKDHRNNIILKLLHSNKKFLNLVSDVMKNIGIGVSNIDIIKSDIPKHIIDDIKNKFKSDKDQTIDDEKIEENIFGLYKTNFWHTVNNKKYKLALRDESSGTRELFYLVPQLLFALASGDTIIYDELENGLHPLVLPHLIAFFTDEQINRNHSQFFGTCHAVDVLKRLTKEQILLVEKNDNLQSNTNRLDSFKGLRRNDNYVAKYLAGEFGATPQITSPLISSELIEEVYPTMTKDIRGHHA